MADFEVYIDNEDGCRWRHVKPEGIEDWQHQSIKSSESYTTPHGCLGNFNLARFACGGTEVPTINRQRRLLVSNGTPHKNYKLNFILGKKRRYSWNVVARNGLIIFASHTTFASLKDASLDWSRTRELMCGPVRVVASYGDDIRVMYEDPSDIRVRMGGAD